MLFISILFILFFIKTATTQTTASLAFTNNSPFKSLIKRNFSLFTTYVDCVERLPVLFHYIADRDVGNLTRVSTFKLDPLVSASCNQKSADTYNSYQSGWDRGHMVPANHLDHSLIALQESNYMTNIVPQTATLNRGAWLLSEEIVECWRDISKLNVFGGSLMTQNTSRDYFLQSHGVRTPEFNWKVIVRYSDGDIIAWKMPNDDTATRKNIDKYLTSLKNIETLTGFTFTQFTTTQKSKI